MTYASVVSLAGAGFGIRGVYASLREGSIQMGHELEALGDALGSTKTLGINGAIMNVSTAVTTQSPSEVLDRFEALCREHPDFLPRALADVPATLEAQVARTLPDGPARFGIVRGGNDAEGALSCFMDDRPLLLSGVADRIRSFLRSHDLAELGRFRYVFVNRTKTGNTHVTTLWTDGHFRLGEMFPASGDAPGDDSAMVPRPPDAKRVFTAAAGGQPFGVRLYRSARSESEIRQFYAEAMPARGWITVGEEPEHHVAGYMKNAGTILYVSTQPVTGGGTMVTTTETARGDTPVEVTVEGRAGGG
ncbi:MAG: hypothetical protein FWD17_12050 [Polyangiaceae bacterium]|nr:hypothetical protein [Polyangiaceae bacterium]